MNAMRRHRRATPPRRATLPRLLMLALLAGLGTAALAAPAEDYMLHCMGCHGAHAEGVPGKVPPLAHSLARFMRSPAGRSYVLRVPGAANSMLSDAQLADVLNWIADSYDGEELAGSIARFTAREVASQRHTPLAAVQAMRSEIVRQLAASGPAPAAQY